MVVSERNLDRWVKLYACKYQQLKLKLPLCFIHYSVDIDFMIPSMRYFEPLLMPGGTICIDWYRRSRALIDELERMINSGEYYDETWGGRVVTLRKAKYAEPLPADKLVYMPQYTRTFNEWRPA